MRGASRESAEKKSSDGMEPKLPVRTADSDDDHDDADDVGDEDDESLGSRDESPLSINELLDMIFGKDLRKLRKLVNGLVVALAAVVFWVGWRAREGGDTHLLRLLVGFECLILCFGGLFNGLMAEVLPRQGVKKSQEEERKQS